MADKDTIYVKSALPTRKEPGSDLEAHPCAFWEKDPAHPDGEVFVTAADGVVEVGKTPQVFQAIKDERLVQVERGKAKE